jgi:hypothetical protein
MSPNTEKIAIDIGEEIPLTMSIRFKEYFFLLIIFFMGFSGMSLCIDKLYPEKKEKIQDIIIHDIDFAYLDVETKH